MELGGYCFTFLRFFNFFNFFQALKLTKWVKIPKKGDTSSSRDYVDISFPFSLKLNNNLNHPSIPSWYPFNNFYHHHHYHHHYHPHPYHYQHLHYHHILIHLLFLVTSSPFWATISQSMLVVCISSSCHLYLLAFKQEVKEVKKMQKQRDWCNQSLKIIPS